MEGGCGDVDNSCDFFYEWNGGAATGNNLPDVDELQQGNYSVTVTDEFGCEGVYTLSVMVLLSRFSSYRLSKSVLLQPYGIF